MCGDSLCLELFPWWLMNGVEHPFTCFLAISASVRSLLPDVCPQTFLPFCGLSPHFPNGVLGSTNVCNFDEAQFIFLLLLVLFGVVSENLLPNPRSQKFTPLFSSKTFRVSALTLGPFGVSICVWPKVRGQLNLFTCWYPAVPAPFFCWRIFFLHWAHLVVWHTQENLH